MVDLVKIRKKAKKKEEADAAKTGVASVPPQSSEPVAAAVESSTPDPVAVPPPAASHEPQATAFDQLPAAPEPSTKLDRFKAEAGKRRGIDREAISDEVAKSQLELLTFVIAGEQYAVDIEGIVEIVTPRAVTRIPNAEVSVVGIMSLRGTIVTLVDVRRKLRHAEAGPPDADTRIVVIDLHGELIGFVVDRVLRVVKADPDEIEAHPVAHATESDAAIRGVFRTAGSLTILLDLDKLLDHRALAASTA